MFRDDQEALRARAEALERELAKERGKSETAEAERRRLEKELAALRREVEKLRPPPPSPDASGRRRTLVFAATAACVVVGGAISVLMSVEVQGEADAVALPVSALPPSGDAARTPWKPDQMPDAPATPSDDGGEPGTVEIVSTPTGAEVFLDDRFLGKTPLVVDLPAGRHELELRTPEGGRSTVSVEVPRGARVNVQVLIPTGDSPPADSPASDAGR